MCGSLKFSTLRPGESVGVKYIQAPNTQNFGLDGLWRMGWMESEAEAMIRSDIILLHNFFYASIKMNIFPLMSGSVT